MFSFFGAYSTQNLRQVNTLNIELTQSCGKSMCSFGRFVIIIEGNSVGDFGPAVRALTHLVDSLADVAVIFKRKSEHQITDL